MRDIKVFENMEFGELEILMIDGKEYFPATECATILGYTNPRKAVADHCKLAGVTKCYASSTRINQHGAESTKKYEKTYINEGNLYRLIIRSKLPQAEKFEKWVFEEVLPSIRKTGGYATTAQIEKLTQIVEGLTKIVTNLVKTVESILPKLEEKQIPIKDKLRYARKSKGLTQKQMSDVVRIPYRTYAKYEQGACNPSKKRTLLLAQFIDLILGIQ